jgi:chromosome segregation ATPase
MKIRSVLIVVLVGLAGVVGATASRARAAQPKSNAVGSAKSRLEQAKKEVAAAQTALNSALAAMKTAEDHAKEVRKKVEAEFDSATDLVAARAEFKKYDEEFTQLKDPLLEQLQKQADYQAALAAKEAAKKKTPKEFSDATAKVKGMAVAAIDASPQAKAAYASKTESEKKLQELIKKRDAAMEKDSRIMALKGDHDKAKAAVANAQAKLAKERKEAGEAQQKLAQEEQKAHQPKQKPQPKKHR